MNIYVSGLYCGPNPSPGVAVARSLRRAFPGASLIGVDYSNRSCGLHWPDFDDLWLQRPWNELDPAEYARQIERLLENGHVFISGLDLETHWLARTLPHHPNLLTPPLPALKATAKPQITASAALPIAVPPSVAASASDRELHAFCRRQNWRVWIKGPYHDALRVARWAELPWLRSALGRTWATEALHLQAHVPGREESIAFAAHDGQLLDSVYMVKNEVTPEGKTWAGTVSPVPAEILEPLTRVVADLGWTGGAELEMICDDAGGRWLIDWNPRFPAWIYGATLAGHNLPALLVASVGGACPERSAQVSRQFVRAVVEVPIRLGFPLAPAAESAHGWYATPGKHPSGMPLLAERLHAPPTNSDPRVPVRDPAEHPPPAVAISIQRDVTNCVSERFDTPRWLFLPSTAAAAFQQAAAFAQRARTQGCDVSIAYSVKTNPDERLLNLANDMGFCFEAISQLEVRRALALGVPGDRIVLNGPGKWWPASVSTSTPLRAVFCDSLSDLRYVLGRLRGGEEVARVVGARLRWPRGY